MISNRNCLLRSFLPGSIFRVSTIAQPSTRLSPPLPYLAFLNYLHPIPPSSAAIKPPKTPESTDQSILHNGCSSGGSWSPAAGRISSAPPPCPSRFCGLGWWRSQRKQKRSRDHQRGRLQCWRINNHDPAADTSTTAATVMVFCPSCVATAAASSRTPRGQSRGGIEDHCFSGRRCYSRCPATSRYGGSGNTWSRGGDGARIGGTGNSIYGTNETSRGSPRCCW